MKKKKALSSKGKQSWESSFPQSLSDQISLPICLLDKHGSIFFYNKLFTKIFEFHNKKLVGKNITQIFPELYLKNIRSIITSLQSDKSTAKKKLNTAIRRKIIKWTFTRIEQSAKNKLHFAAIGKEILEKSSNTYAANEDDFYQNTIFNSINDAVFIYDANNGKIFDVNETTCKMYGYKKEEMLQLEASQSSANVTPYTQKDFFNHLKKAKRGTPQVFEWLAKNKSGKLFWVEVHAKYSKIKNKERFVVTALNISERKVIEDNLRENETELQVIIDSTADGILAVNDRGKVIKANKRFAELWQIPHIILKTGDDNALLNFVLDQLVDPRQFLDKVQQLYQSKLEDLDILSFKDGRIFERYSQPLLMEDKVLGRVWSFRDITEQKRIEQAVSQAELKYRSLFVNASDAILLLTEDTFVDCNPKTEELFGCKREEILNRKPYEFSPPIQPDQRDSKQKALEKINAALSGEPQLFEWAHKKLDGTLFNAEVNLNRIEIDKKPMLQAIVRDITERKRTEEVLSNERTLLRTIIDLIPDAVYVKDVKGQKILANPKEVQFAGKKSEDEVIGKTDFDLYPESEAKRSNVEDRSVLHSGKPILNIEGKLIDGEGQLHWTLGSKVPLLDVHDKITGIVGLTHDITERKRAEEALKESENKYRLLVENAHDMVFTLNTDGFLKYISPSSKAFSGYDSIEENGEHFRKYFVDESQLRLAFLALTKIVQNHEPIVFEFLFRPKDRLPFWVEVVGNPIVNNGGVVEIHCIMRDINKRKEAEEKLVRSEEKYRELVENAREAIFVVQNSIIRFVNRTAIKMMERSEAEIIGHSLFDFIPVEDRKKIERLDYQLFNGEISESQREYCLHQKEGKIILLSVNSVFILWNGQAATLNFASDITLNKFAEEALQQSEKSYHGLFNSVAEAIYIHDSKGNFIDVNDGAVRMYGYSKEFFIGKNPADLAAGGMNDMNEAVAKIKKAFNGEPQQLEFWAKRSNGEIFLKDVHLTKGIYFGKDVIIATAIDITDRKKNEEKIKTTLAEKEVLLREVHHRVKNNLQAIIYLIEMQSDFIEDKQVKEFLMELQERARTMSLVYERLYQSEYLSSVEMQPFLESLTDNVLHSFSAEKRISTNVSAVDICLNVEIAMPCGLIVNELFTNCIKYAFPDKSVQDCQVGIQMELENNYCKLIIKDNGIGLPIGFDWTKAESLGLKLVNLWANYQLKGNIKVDLKHGTTFEISFPYPESKL